MGSPDEIYGNPSNIFVAQFIGTPKMNILKGLCQDDIISSNEVKFLENNIKFDKISFSKKGLLFWYTSRAFYYYLADCEYKFKPKIDLTRKP